jgi:hypothetical protein
MGPALAQGRYDHAASTLAGTKKILLTGGYSQAVEICDFTGAAACAAVSSMSSSRAKHTSTVLPDGKVLVMGGTNGWQLSKTIEIFTPTAPTFLSGSWADYAKVMRVERAGHNSILLSSGKVLITGADNQVLGITTPLTELWEPEP